MIHRMAIAFFGAEIADPGAERAHLDGELAAARHIACGDSADLRAVHVEVDAARELIAIRLEKTGDRAMVARLGARIAGGDTGSILFVVHGGSQLTL